MFAQASLECTDPAALGPDGSAELPFVIDYEQLNFVAITELAPRPKSEVRTNVLCFSFRRIALFIFSWTNQVVVIGQD